MKRWSIWIVVILAAAAVGGAAYLGLQSTQADETATPQRPDTVTVTRGDVQQSVTAPGYLVSAHETVLGARIGGRLDALYVRPGDEVQAGDVLAELEIENLLEGIAQAEARLALAKLRLSEGQKSREHQIVQKGQDLAAAQARLAQAVGHRRPHDGRHGLHSARAQHGHFRDLGRHASHRLSAIPSGNRWQPDRLHRQQRRRHADLASDGTRQSDQGGRP